MGAGCVTVTVCPAMVIAPVRCVVPVFGATLKLTLPFPVPLGVPVSVIQVTPVNELHPHPAAAVIVTDPVPPPAGTVCDVGLTAYVQGAAAACVTVNV